MTITLSIIIVILLFVIYCLFFQNRPLSNKPQDCKVEKEEEIDYQSFESTYYVIKEKITKKKEAIEIVNKVIGRNELSKENTNFSKLNKAKPVWWFDILPEKFTEDLHLILGKDEGFIWITIPKDVITDVNNVFRVRDDNGRVQLVISSEPGVYYLRDVATGASGFNFEQYIQKEFY